MATLNLAFYQWKSTMFLHCIALYRNTHIYIHTQMLNIIHLVLHFAEAWDIHWLIYWHIDTHFFSLCSQFKIFLDCVPPTILLIPFLRQLFLVDKGASNKWLWLYAYTHTHTETKHLPLEWLSIILRATTSQTNLFFGQNNWVCKTLIKEDSIKYACLILSDGHSWVHSSLQYTNAWIMHSLHPSQSAGTD